MRRSRSLASAVLTSIVLTAVGRASSTEPKPHVADAWRLEVCDKGLDVRWYAPCVASVDRSDLVCVQASGAPDIPDYSTFMLAHDSQSVPKRVQSLPAEPDVPWRVFVDSPADEVCVTQKYDAGDFKDVCGRLAVDEPTSHCPKPSDTPTWSRCELRPVPLDNPDFPHLPSPETSGGWFAPWAVYEQVGTFPGDLDKWFMLNVSPDALGMDGPGPTPAQRRALDLLAWQELIALHWPSDPDNALIRRGLPAVDGDVDCPAWAAWRRAVELLPPDGSLPIAWEAKPDAGSQGKACAILGDHKLAQLSATDVDARLDPEQADGCILWDVDGFPIFYEVRVNRPAFEYVLRRGLYTGAVPEGTVSFPDGKYYVPGGPGVAKTGLVKAPAEMQGTVAIKMAWKMLGSDDDESRFIVTLQRDPQVLTAARGVKDARSDDCAADAPDLSGTAPERSDGSVSRNSSFAPAARWSVGVAGAKTPTAIARGASPAGSLTPEELRHVRFLQERGLTKPSEVAVIPMPAENSAPAAGRAGGGLGRSPGGPLTGKLFAERGCHVQDGQRICRFGLVAIHVTHKTSNNQKWNWSTFIHRDAFGAESPDGKGRQLFATSACDAKDRDPKAGNRTGYGEDGRRHTQVCERTKAQPATERLNEEVRRMLLGCKTDLVRRLANYRLLSSQWVPPTGKLADRDPPGALNPLMETFHMHRDVDCLTCHERAAWKADDGNRVSADFMFFPTVKRPVRPYAD